MSPSHILVRFAADMHRYHLQERTGSHGTFRRTMVQAAADVHHDGEQVEHVVRVVALVGHVAQLQLEREHHAVHELAQPGARASGGLSTDTVSSMQHTSTPSPSGIRLHLEQRPWPLAPKPNSLFTRFCFDIDMWLEGAEDIKGRPP